MRNTKLYVFPYPSIIQAHLPGYSKSTHTHPSNAWPPSSLPSASKWNAVRPTFAHGQAPTPLFQFKHINDEEFMIFREDFLQKEAPDAALSTRSSRRPLKSRSKKEVE
jgi:hypothetical protein